MNTLTFIGGGMCVSGCDAERTVVWGGVSHLCINSLIDPVPHCIQHVYSRDRDGKRERVRLGVGQLGIKDRVL